MKDDGLVEGRRRNTCCVVSRFSRELLIYILHRFRPLYIVSFVAARIVRRLSPFMTAPRHESRAYIRVTVRLMLRKKKIACENLVITLVAVIGYCDRRERLLFSLSHQKHKRFHTIIRLLGWTTRIQFTFGRFEIPFLSFSCPPLMGRYQLKHKE